MNAFDQVFNQFKKQGYNQDSYLNENEIYRLLDAIAANNAGISQYDRSIAQQLWVHSQPDPVKGVRLRDFINSIIEAQNILREQINTTQTALTIQNNPSRKAQLQDQYNQILSDHHIISAPFRLPPLRQADSNMVSGILRNRVYAPPGSHHTSHHADSGIFNRQANPREQSSTDLLICMFLSVFMLVLQLILMFHKHHFLNILCIFGILSIFFLNYFDKNYMRFLLILIAVSILLDAIWLGIHASQYWHSVPQTQHSTLHSGFLSFIFIMVMVLAGLKLIAGGILFKYRNNGQSYRKTISTLGYKIKLDGRPTFNPFSPLLRAVPTH